MVIQRWQSVLLLLTTALMACFTFLSIGQVQTPDYTYNFTCIGFAIEGEPTDGSLSGMQIYTWLLFCISLVATILPFATIFLYRNLPLQKKCCMVETLFIIAALAVAGYEGYCEFPGYSVGWSALIVAPFLAIITTVMAWNCIRKDHKLLKSVDRIR